jgi:carboxynorspermidine decarboxylase
MKSPCFVLEEALLIKNLELIRRVKAETGVHIILALKGFAMWKAFGIVRQYLDGATASSLYEARLCFEEMNAGGQWSKTSNSSESIDAQRLQTIFKTHTYAVVYFEEEFSRIMKYSSHITFNSLNQFQKFYPRIKKFNSKQSNVSAGLRINPEYSVVETELYNPGKAGSRLGIDINLLGDNLPEGVEGLHVHCLCESSAADTEGLINMVEEKLGKYFSKLKWINFGGGHLMTREGYDVEKLITSLKNFKKRYPHLDIILEPGSAVAWNAGFLKASVMDIVDNHGVKTIVTDVSFTAHMPDTLEMPYRPKVKVISKIGNNHSQNGHNPTSEFPLPYSYRIGGTSCLSGDYMAEYDFEKEVHIGDTIIFEDMMHYTMVKTSTFNGVKHPDIGMIKRDGSFELFRRFDYKDYRNRLS